MRLLSAPANIKLHCPRLLHSRVLIVRRQPEDAGALIEEKKKKNLPFCWRWKHLRIGTGLARHLQIRIPSTFLKKDFFFPPCLCCCFLLSI